MKKETKELIKRLNYLAGEDATNALLYILYNSVENLLKNCETRLIRDVEITYNNFFSTKFDFTKNEYVE